MAIKPYALFSAALRDVEHHVSPDTFSRIALGKDVEHLSSSREFAAAALMRNLLKKCITLKEPSADEKAIAKFRAANEVCAAWELAYSDLIDEYLWGELKSYFYGAFYPQGEPLIEHWQQIFDASHFGPGASLDALGTDFYRKVFAGPLSASSETIVEAYHGCCSVAGWTLAERQRFSAFEKQDTVGAADRLQCVPKRNDISRVIAIGPSLNVMFQLGIGDILRQRILALTGVDLRYQSEKNAKLARLGSISNDWVTIDLESASDRISTRLMERLIPPSQYGWFEATRSKEWESSSGRGTYEMMAGMGNGFVFPLQTLLFIGMVVAAFKISGIAILHPRGTAIGNYGVYGDDIVVPRTVAPALLRLLRLCGMKVNDDKTFLEGPFRESCGSDFFLGSWVRSVYIKGYDTEQDAYAIINSLNLFSFRTGIAVPNLIAQVKADLLPRGGFLVPMSETDGSGIKVPYSFVTDVGYATKRSRPLHGSIVYRRSVYNPKRIKIGDASVGIKEGNRSTLLYYNASGLLISFVGGYVKARSDQLRVGQTLVVGADAWLKLTAPYASITVREGAGDIRRYTSDTAISSNWDYTANSDIARCWRRWETVVTLNLME